MENRIVKDAVIGFAITKEGGIIPLTMGWDGTTDEYCLDIENIEVISVIPAPPGSLQVLGLKSNSEVYSFLGYEIPGADSPDWEKKLDSGIVKEVEA